jgi:hypothetical protein
VYESRGLPVNGFILLMSDYMGRNSVISIATRYGLDGPGIESRWGRDFPYQSRQAPGAHPASGGSCPGLKRPGLGVDHPPHLAPRLKEE